MKVYSINLNKFFSNIPKWNVEEFCGCKPFTTFWEDFRIADVFSKKGDDLSPIRDTYQRAITQWKGDIKYLTELAMVLNHSAGFWWGVNPKLSKEYSDLYLMLDELILTTFKKDEVRYYLDVTD